MLNLKNIRLSRKIATYPEHSIAVSRQEIEIVFHASRLTKDSWLDRTTEIIVKTSVFMYYFSNNY